jgi:peptidoglycan/xylan/chitin deacetylase (PgdA/CDA1 family)
VVVDTPGWLSRAEVRRLDRLGTTIAAHSWDHQPVPGYRGGDWRLQLLRAARELGRLVGHRVRLLPRTLAGCVAVGCRATGRAAESATSATRQLRSPS